MQEIAPGLHRWTAWHDHWEEDVGALAVETGDGLVFIDPIDPPVELGPPAHVLVTVYWHGRTSGELGAERRLGVDPFCAAFAKPRHRGDASVPRRRRAPRRDRGVSDRTQRRGRLLAPRASCGRRRRRTARRRRKPRPTDEPLRLCPERWLGKKTHDDLRETLRPLLDLPVERVLVSHGIPVVDGGKRALAAVLD